MGRILSSPSTRSLSTPSPMALLAFLALASASSLHAEFSPLSYHAEGFGLEQTPNTAREMGMGEVGMASIVKQGLSISNSSRTAFYEKTSFTATANGDLDWLKDDETSNHFATFLIPNIGLNFHMKKYGHLALYYRQRYHRNFSYTPMNPVKPEAVQSFSAEGGVYEAAATYALAPIPSLAVGIGFHYLMGRERLIEPAVFDGNPANQDLFNSLNLDGDTVNTRSQGGYPSLSATWRRPKFSLALSGALGVTLDQEIERSVTNIVSNQKRTAEKEMPWTLAAGLSLKPTGNQTIVSDFVWEAWNDEDSDLLNPAFLLGIGYEFAGRPGQYETYYKRMAYRGGLGFERIYLDETNLYFLTAGTGLPLGRRGSLLDFAIKYGHRSSAENNLWSEDFIKLSVSLTGVGNWGQSVRKRK